MPHPVIETERLTKSYGKIRAVHNIALAVQAGEMFSLVGPDGAGKTTIIRMLCGILRPTSGGARILGLDLIRESEKIKQSIGYLSQKFSLYGDLTVDENIEFFAEIHGVTNYKMRREELLEFTRLTPFRSRLADRLSGGMRQKLALACTLVHAPRLILLDEPTTGVDPVSRRDFWSILSGLLRTGVTIVLSTPYLDEAERCSRIGLINRGEMMIMDTPQHIKSLMKGVILEIVCNGIRRAAEILRPLVFVIEIQVFGDRLHVIVADHERDFPLLRKELNNKGVEIESWRVVPPSLENVFISLTRSS
jgi:ABC-2 type transport system ATP-binding protein